jgi:hypothetical protein
MKKMISPCIAVPDLDSKEKHSYIFIKSKAEWLPILFKHMEDPNEDGSLEMIKGVTSNEDENDHNAVINGQWDIDEEDSEESSI